MKIHLIPTALVLLALTACQETPQETAEDVAEARADGAEEVREAEADRAEAQRDAATDPAGPTGPVMDSFDPVEDKVDADYDVAVAKAKAALDVEQEKCEAMTGDARDNCKEAAEAIYDKAVADAELRRTQTVREAVPAEGAPDADGDR